MQRTARSNPCRHGPAELLRANLRHEERHADYLETQLSLIKQVGLANFLTQVMAE